MANIKTSQDIDWVQLKDQASAPANPSAGFKRIYAKSDGLYVLNSAGVETGPLGTGGGGGGGQANWFQLSGAVWTGSGTNPVPSGDWYALEFKAASWENPQMREGSGPFSSGEMTTYGGNVWNLFSSLGGTTTNASSGDRTLLIPRTGLYLLSAYATFNSNSVGDMRKIAIIQSRSQGSAGAPFLAGQNQPSFIGSRGKVQAFGVNQWYTADSKPPMQTGVTEMSCSTIALVQAGVELALIARHDRGSALGCTGYLAFAHLQDIPANIASLIEFMSPNSSSSHVLGFHSDLSSGGGA